MQPSNFYQLNENDPNSVRLENIKFKTQGTNRAFCFLSTLSHALKTGHLDTKITMEQLNGVISDIQARVEGRKFYNLMSKVPFTNANSVSRLLQKVKNQVEQKKQDQVAEKTKQLTDLTAVAKNNRTDCNQYFIASEKLKKLIDDSKNAEANSLTIQQKPNQYILFYALGEREVGRIGSKATSFMNSRGVTLVPFMLEFESTNGLVKILDPDPTNSEIKKYQTMDVGHFSNITKQDVFNALISI